MRPHAHDDRARAAQADQFDQTLRVLGMVRALHKAGYEWLRVCTGTDANGAWRCFITPASNMFYDGWQPMGLDRCEIFVANMCSIFFGWDDSANNDSRSLAVSFIFRCSSMLKAAEGRDPAYVRWFAARLREAELGRLPVLFEAGQFEAKVGAPTPPPLPANVEPDRHDIALLATASLTLTDLPPASACDDQVTAFALSFDGYLWAEATGRNLQQVAEDIQVGRNESPLLGELRAAAFHWQRCAKWSDTAQDMQIYLGRAGSAIEQIRRLLAVSGASRGPAVAKKPPIRDNGAR